MHHSEINPKTTFFFSIHVSEDINVSGPQQNMPEMVPLYADASNV